jgi:alpha-L-fucosidase
LCDKYRDNGGLGGFRGAVQAELGLPGRRLQTPDWFRDAKFGIWAHWSAQCVPEMGDWYARQMYQQGNWQYDHHVKTYGHPTKSASWRSEPLEGRELGSRRADGPVREGGCPKYFVAIANHHDNFDMFDSKYHAWNTMRVGPKKDIVGTWEKVARAAACASASATTARTPGTGGSPPTATTPKGRAGQRYDAFNLTKADGKGKWWEGLDPQDLYTGRNMVMPDGFKTIRRVEAWHDAERPTTGTRSPRFNNPAFMRSWYLRCRDLIDSYKPDLVYIDNYGLPLGQAGLDIAAHYYNASMAWHGGKLEAVLNAKVMPAEWRAGVVEDVERGFREGIEPLPWQTDTCIGDWHYNRGAVRQPRLQVGRQRHPPPGGHRLQERQPAAVGPDARRRHHRCRRAQDPGRHRRMDGAQRRGHLWHPAMAQLRRRPDRSLRPPHGLAVGVADYRQLGDQRGGRGAAGRAARRRRSPALHAWAGRTADRPARAAAGVHAGAEDQRAGIGVTSTATLHRSIAP